MVRHAPKNALIPAVTMIGLQLGHCSADGGHRNDLFAPGHRSAGSRRHSRSRLSTRAGPVLFAATVYVLINLAVDVSYAIIDPRIRYR